MLLRRLKFLGWLVAVLVVVLGGSYAFAPQWLVQATIKREAMAAHVDQNAVQVGDTHWVYYEGGQGPTIVLLHGFAADKSEWLKVARLLTPHFHVIIPDLPGWGHSSRNADASYDLQAQAARLDGFVQALGLQRFVLAGHSTGGAVAAIYAAGHDDHVAGLALVDAYGLQGGGTALEGDPTSGQTPFVFDDRSGYQRAMAMIFNTPPQPPGRFVDVQVKRNQVDRTFIERKLKQLREPSQALAVQQRLGQLTMPVLGLWCHDDRLVNLAALNSLRNGLTRASAISTSTLAGCNHMPMLEKPEETAQVLIGFALSH